MAPEEVVLRVQWPEVLLIFSDSDSCGSLCRPYVYLAGLALVISGLHA
jgi:hypothetical protein